MAGGGTGGHVIPALAVARELRRRGHEAFFVGTRTGMEATLVPAEGFPIDWIEIGGLKRVGAARAFRTLGQLPASVFQVARLIEKIRPQATFSMGGYAAGPVVLAAWLRRLPVAVMEPNAVPGFTNRRIGRFVARALLSFPETARYFPPGRSEVTGLPVRSEFFSIPPKRREEPLTVLVTGGSRGSRTLNRAAKESWPLFRDSGFPVRFIHQTGTEGWAEIDAEFRRSGLEGEVVPFLDDMARAFAAADLVVCRSGAGAVAEVAAAGKPSILVPFPFAADDHQLRNAEAFERAGAARLVRDAEMTGKRLFEQAAALAAEPGTLERMGEAARKFAKPWAAQRAADVLEEIGGR
ncbi:MAG: undecaprenyldiphospho-muramoylpentapeptide beta-N-acetylglucosaminyltransferase [Bryobacteraceae bacterium]|nr:undecaprenyldiphospho-muramoylpentapeptide beta-N-acetylglucosaminyltransferase [Bryobacteraceae bacterium]